jgi:uncharacterized damage-inducible protein DinB
MNRISRSQKRLDIARLPEEMYAKTKAPHSRITARISRKRQSGRRAILSAPPERAAGTTRTTTFNWQTMKEQETHMNRYSTIILAALFVAAASASALAQQPQQSGAPQNSNPMIAELKQMYTTIKNNQTKMAEKMPEENYSFKATADIRTFGKLVAHVADSQARFCSAVNGEQKAVNADSKTSKADLVAALKESFDMCDKAFDSLTDAKAAEMVSMGQRQSSKLGILARMVSHSNEEYGYMAVYLRLKSVVPPSSEGR